MAQNPPQASAPKESLPSISQLLHHLHVEKSPEMSPSAQIAAAVQQPSSASSTPSSKSPSDCRKLSLAFLLTTDEPVIQQSAAKDTELSSCSMAAPKAPRLDTDFIMRNIRPNEPSLSTKEPNKGRKVTAKAVSKRPSRRKDTTLEDADIVQSILQTIDKSAPISPNQINITKSIPGPSTHVESSLMPTLSLSRSPIQVPSQIRLQSIDSLVVQSSDSDFPQLHTQLQPRYEFAGVTATKHFEPVYSIGAATNMKQRIQPGANSSHPKPSERDNYFRFPAQSSFTHYDFKSKMETSRKGAPQSTRNEHDSQPSPPGGDASFSTTDRQYHSAK